MEEHAFRNYVKVLSSEDVARKREDIMIYGSQNSKLIESGRLAGNSGFPIRSHWKALPDIFCIDPVASSLLCFWPQ
jgi:hypothetical protein